MAAYLLNVTLLVLLLLASQAPPQLNGVYVTEEMIGDTEARPIHYHASSEPYDELVGTFIDVGANEKVSDLPAYPEQTAEGTSPPRWIPLDLVGRDEENDQVRLLVRGDSGYLIGFANRSMDYHTLEGTDQNLIPGATVMETGVEYKDFVGTEATRDKLATLPLSKELFLDGIHTLANNGAFTADERDLALVRFVVMICEASRFKEIRQRISENWDVGVCHIDAIHAEYTVKWAHMSLLLFCAERGIALRGLDATRLRRIHVETPDQVKNILGSVLRTRRFNPADAEKSCAPIPRIKTEEQKQKEKKKHKRRRQRGGGSGHYK